MTAKVTTNIEIDGMRTAGRLAAEVLEMIEEHIIPGITTEDIDKICHSYIVETLGCIPAPLNYSNGPGQIPFPKSICTSVNHVVCHGIPQNKFLNEGDIVNVDVPALKDGWHGDTSRMFFVGNVKIKGQRLVNITYEAMFEGIKAVRPGATLGDIGYSIQNFVENQGFSVVRDFCGHGIGQTFHCPPNVMHYGNKGEGLVLKEGMIFTIEPMVNSGKYQTKILDDGWTAVTKDRSLSAQFEHTVGITENGYEIFTESVKGYSKPPY